MTVTRAELKKDLQELGHTPASSITFSAKYCLVCGCYFDVPIDGAALTWRGERTWKGLLSCAEAQIAEIIE